MKVKSISEYRCEIDEALKDKKVNIDLFVENSDGVEIRAGPKLEKIFGEKRRMDKFKSVQEQFQIRMNSMKFMIPQALEEAGMPEKEIQIAKNSAKAEKEATLEWIENKYRFWKPVWEFLKKEKEREEGKERRRFGLQE